MKKTLLLGAAVVLATAGLARAADPTPAEIRQTGLDLLAGTFGNVRGVVAAKGDVKPLEGSGKAIARFAKLMPSLFPKGSDAGTKAAPEIWSDNAGFLKAAAALGDAGTKLAMAAKDGNADGVAAAAKDIGDACGGCHKTYRAK